MLRRGVSIVNVASVVVLAGCGGAPTREKPHVDPQPTTFQWKRAADPFPARWGQFLLSGRPAGGSAGQNGPVLGDVFEPETLASIDASIAPRWCSCGFFVPSTNELVVVGGYGEGFVELRTAEIVPLNGGASTEIDVSATLPDPIGCAAYFDDASNRGYVFGGGDDAAAVFSDATLTYDPASRAFSVLASASGDNPHPSGRYDPAWVPLATSPGASDDIVLLAGRGGTAFAIEFPTDVWSFHPSNGTWTEIDVDGGSMPGRRFPAYTASPAHNAVLIAFGSDTAAGEHQLSDVWLFDLSTKSLRAVDVAPDDAGEAPTPRVFTPFVASNAPLVAGGVGIVGGHLTVLTDDAFAVAADADEWH